MDQRKESGQNSGIKAFHARLQEVKASKAKYWDVGTGDLMAFEEGKGLGVPGDWADLRPPLFSC